MVRFLIKETDVAIFAAKADNFKFQKVVLKSFCGVGLTNYPK